MLRKMKTTLKLIEDFCIQTDKKMKYNHPDIVVLVDNKAPINEVRLTLDKNGIMHYHIS